jgi:hypothetical protein
MINEDSFDRLFGLNVRDLLFTVQKALPPLSSDGVIVLRLGRG